MNKMQLYQGQKNMLREKMKKKVVYSATAVGLTACFRPVLGGHTYKYTYILLVSAINNRLRNFLQSHHNSHLCN
jgi:hypothetical protein